MKKTIIALAAAAAVLLASAFGVLSVGDVEQYAIVHAVGVDSADSGVKLSFQVFRVSSSGSQTPVDPTKTNSEIVSAEGETIESAVSKCETQLGKELYFGHNRLLVISESVENIYSCLDYFSKKDDCYIGMTTAACEGSAEDILNSDISSGTVAAETMQRIFETAYAQGKTVDFDFLKITSDYIDTNGSVVLPLAKKREQAIADRSKESGEPAQDALEVSQAVIVKDGSFAQTLSESEVLGVRLLSGEIENADVVINLDGEKISVEVESEDVSLKIDSVCREAIFDIKIKVTADSQKNSTERERIADAVEAKLSECVENAVEKADGTDIFNLTAAVRSIDYDEYLNITQNAAAGLEIEANIAASSR